MAATSAAIKGGKFERKRRGLAPARRKEEALFVLRRRGDATLETTAKKGRQSQRDEKRADSLLAPQQKCAVIATALAPAPAHPHDGTMKNTKMPPAAQAESFLANSCRVISSSVFTRSRE